MVKECRLLASRPMFVMIFQLWAKHGMEDFGIEVTLSKVIRPLCNIWPDLRNHKNINKSVYLQYNRSYLVFLPIEKFLFIYKRIYTEQRISSLG